MAVAGMRAPAGPQALAEGACPCPPVNTLLPRRCEEDELSKCWMSEPESPVSLCKSGPEKCKTSFTDFSLAEIIQINYSTRSGYNKARQHSCDRRCIILQFWGPGGQGLDPSAS